MCKLGKLGLPLTPWNQVAHMSLYVSLVEVWVSVSEGQRLLFQVSVPVTLGQEVYEGAWCYFLWTSPCKQTEISQIIKTFWLVNSTRCTRAINLREIQHLYSGFLEAYCKHFPSIHDKALWGKKLVHCLPRLWNKRWSRTTIVNSKTSDWTDQNSRYPWISWNTPRTTCPDLELDCKIHCFSNWLNNFLSSCCILFLEK